MLFNAGAKASTLAAVVGALANTGRLVLIDEFHVPWQLAVGLAAVTIGVLAQLFVSRASLSRVALSVPAVVIMIPGVPFYRAIPVYGRNESRLPPRYRRFQNVPPGNPETLRVT